MSTEELTARERSELCDLMREVGADAPTLNEGWNVLDLAAHLVVREHDLWAAGGIVFGGPFKKALDVAMDRRRRQGLAKLVATIGKGEPIWWRLAPKGSQFLEYYVHHEDVRRPNGGGPRTDRPDLDEKLRRLLRNSAQLALRNVDAGVELVTDGETLFRSGPERRAILTGPPGDLLLYITGRRQAAQVDLSGDPGALEVLDTAQLGF